MVDLCFLCLGGWWGVCLFVAKDLTFPVIGAGLLWKTGHVLHVPPFTINCILHVIFTLSFPQYTLECSH
jgi:hypothetical protein